MSRLRILALVHICVATTLSCGEKQQAADLVLHNGKVATVDGNFSIQEAVAVKGDRFVFVGSNEDVDALCWRDDGSDRARR